MGGLEEGGDWKTNKEGGYLKSNSDFGNGGWKKGLTEVQGKYQIEASKPQKPNGPYGSFLCGAGVRTLL